MKKKKGSWESNAVSPTNKPQWLRVNPPNDAQTKIAKQNESRVDHGLKPKPDPVEDRKQYINKLKEYKR